MAATYLHPGVYVEEVPSGARPIEAVGTSTAVFLGFTATTHGVAVGEATLVTRFEEYADKFGGYRDQGTSDKGDPMAYSVAAFFHNGGAKAYVVPVAVLLDTAQGYQLVPGDSTRALIFTSTDPGAWANGLIVRVTAGTPAGAGAATPFTVEVGRWDARGSLVASERYPDVDVGTVVGAMRASRLVTVAVAGADSVSITPARSYRVGTSTSATLDPADLALTGLAADARTLTLALDGGATFSVMVPAENFGANFPGLAAALEAAVRRTGAGEAATLFTAVVRDSKLVLTSGSRMDTSAVVVSAGSLATRLGLGAGAGGTELAGAASELARVGTGPIELAGGGDGVDGDIPAYEAALATLTKQRDINIICLPGQEWAGTGKAIIGAAISHAEQMGDRMVIVDPPSAAVLRTDANVADLVLPTQKCAVLYHPWVKAANVFFDAERNAAVPQMVLVPPSGYAAGMWSKIDARRGVWKAPAGVETGLLGVASLAATVDDAEQDALNPLGVNCLRVLPSFGPVIWGARTLATRAAPEWRYVPVRRTAIFIERSLYGGIQWAVFEPNDAVLWSSLRTNIESFMNGLFRAGAFQGQKAGDAYFVRCGLGDTMTQDDIDAGRVVVLVGFAPLKPAEFVIIRLQQKVGQS
jgi:uncharacterized protein